jgi:hypothetical protein
MITAAYNDPAQADFMEDIKDSNIPMPSLRSK